MKNPFRSRFGPNRAWFARFVFEGGSIVAHATADASRDQVEALRARARRNGTPVGGAIERAR
ncbi:MAG: hypothetical protein JWL83_2974 [Actinomycetia bacterium]|nr:hypothetical protein [Actinomycetes bacterium]